MNTAEKIALASVIIAVVSLIAFVVHSIPEPTPTPPPTPLIPTPTIGSISVSSSPSGASIYLDGSYKGTTPMTIKNVEKGSYTIALKYTGYQDWSQTISVRAGDITYVSLSLTPKPTPTPTPLIPTPTLLIPTPTIGSISVSSSPSGASIYLDGSYKGTTPMTIKNVEKGSYTIALKYTGYQDWSQTISVRAGDITYVSLSLTPKPTPTPTEFDLEGEIWTLTSSVYGETEQSPIQNTTITAHFEDGEITGSAGCNNYFGAYTVDGNEINISKALGTTMMYCGQEGVMQQEYQYLEMLGNVTTCTIEENQLTLSTEDGGALVYQGDN